MQNYDITQCGKLPIYEYLYRCMRRDILSGKLPREEKLLSKRALARKLNVSIITVENAYAQLNAEGYIVARQRSGYYVSSLEPCAAPKTRPPAAPPRRKAEVPQKYLLDMKTNRVNTAWFPYSVWAKLQRQELSQSFQYMKEAGPFNGEEVLRRAIAEYLCRARDISVSTDQIVIGAGTEYLYNVLIQLLGHDMVYAVEDPGYYKEACIYRKNGVKYCYVSIDGSGLSVSGLERSGASVAHITASHHYPTGIVMPIGRRQELLRWAGAADGRYIIEDDYDSEFRYVGIPIQPLFNIDRNEKVIYLNSFTMTISPALRISYMILPPHLAAGYRREMSFYSCSVPRINQLILARFLSEGYFEKYLSRSKTAYLACRRAVIGAIRTSPFAQRVTIRENAAGQHFILTLDTRRSDREITAIAERQGILLSFVSEYLAKPDPGYDHQLIINYSGIDVKKLPEGISRMAGAFGAAELDA